MYLVGPYDIVAGGFLLGSGYCRRNRWRFPECILFLRECVLGPGLIFGRTGRWPAPWAALLLRGIPGREKMVEGQKRRRCTPKTSVTFIFVTPIGKCVNIACWHSRNPFKNVCFGMGGENLNSTMRVFKNTKIHSLLKGFRKIAFRSEMFLVPSIIDFGAIGVWIRRIW